MKPFAARLERLLGSRVESASPLHGGDINRAYEVRLADGRSVFAKTNASAAPEMFAVEARGLDWLRAAGALRIPEVIATDAQVLVLELISSAPERFSFADDLGRGLAALHLFGASTFGLDHSNFVGRVPQTNRSRTTWAEFYGECRIAPLVQSARDAGLVDRALGSRCDTLLARLPELVGPAEPPARLHGDLWSGNLIVDERGAPCLIDPAVYGGHREIDLAMMKLFGGFSERAFAAYREAAPLAPGYEERLPLYQLYPLLVHVALFGAGYVSGVARAVARYV